MHLKWKVNSKKDLPVFLAPRRIFHVESLTAGVPTKVNRNAFTIRCACTWALMNLLYVYESLVFKLISPINTTLVCVCLCVCSYNGQVIGKLYLYFINYVVSFSSSFIASIGPRSKTRASQQVVSAWCISQYTEMSFGKILVRKLLNNWQRCWYTSDRCQRNCSSHKTHAGPEWTAKTTVLFLSFPKSGP